MKMLLGSIVLVGAAVMWGVARGTGHGFLLLFLVGSLLHRILPAWLLQASGGMFWMQLIFWVDVGLFTGPAYGVYRARHWLGGGYPVILSAWSALYIWSVLFTGRLSEWP